MNSELRARLESLADPGYRAFSARLLPVGTPLLGVRLPALRRIARELSRGDWRAYLDGAADGSFEEILLQGMVIGYAEMDMGERQHRTAAFVPKIRPCGKIRIPGGRFFFPTSPAGGNTPSGSGW